MVIPSRLGCPSVRPAKVEGARRLKSCACRIIPPSRSRLIIILPKAQPELSYLSNKQIYPRRPVKLRRSPVLICLSSARVLFGSDQAFPNQSQTPSPAAALVISGFPVSQSVNQPAIVGHRVQHNSTGDLSHTERRILKTGVS
ncbi:hypothetical protein PGT21_003843 [Puccinia graminis f. sp. tritici]|uniref:Uncharacterized protein n=1 Tax=Puccinia graminis f. sp. tritici TaxID=56615 RepID=A0A5B0QZM1_PUCGR|nr:hypothetical protein PGT21_003843 [Puccinia graminis f. sp. tritici]